MPNWWKSWWKTRQQQFRLTVRRWNRDNGNMIAAAMAYYAALSFFPLMLLLISILGFVLQFSSGAQNAQKELLQLFAQNTAPALAEHVQNALGAISAKALVGGPIGLVTLMLASIMIFTHIDIAMARIWNTNRRRSTGLLAAIGNVLSHRLRAFLLLLAIGFLIWAAFVVDTVTSALRPFVAEQLGGGLLWYSARSAFSLLANGVLLALLYKLLPRAHVPWWGAIRGGALAAILWEISRQILTLMLLSKKYTAYGIVGSLMALMLWFYIASIIFFFAAEYVRVISLERGRSAPNCRGE